MHWTSIWELAAGHAGAAGQQDVQLFDLARAAKRELEAARAQFEEVYDPDLVDHAIFRMQAAERHYVYLLREAGR